jgi:ABC-type nitrate/sulfonate/bicarbonate transport system substrate-binding protein
MLFSPEGQAILVKRDSSIQSVKELKGKRIALPTRPSNLIDFRQAMAKRGVIASFSAHGLSESDIKWVKIPIDTPDIAKEAKNARTKEISGWKIAPETGWRTPQQLEIEALNSGEVDAIYASTGSEVVLHQIGEARVIYRLDHHPDWKYRVNIHYPYICTVSTDLASERPDLVTRWIKVLIRAGMWAKTNYSEVTKIFSNSTEATLSPKEIGEYYPNTFHQNLIPEITPRGIAALEIEKDFLREHGFIRKDFDVKTWIDNRFLDDAWKEIG